MLVFRPNPKLGLQLSRQQQRIKLYGSLPTDNYVSVRKAHRSATNKASRTFFEGAGLLRT